MSWPEQKQQFESRKQVLDEATSDKALDNLINSLNTNLKEYTNRAGVSPGAPGQNQFHDAAEQSFVSLMTLQQQYQNLIKDISRYLSGVTSSQDLQNKLREVAVLQDQIARAEKNLQDAKQEAETSKTRQLSVQHPEQQLSWYQGFSAKIGFVRPLKLLSIPFLIVFGLLFLFFSGLILKDFFSPSLGTFGLDQATALPPIFTDSRFYSVLAGITFVSVLIGILAAKGYLGKRM